MARKVIPEPKFLAPDFYTDPFQNAVRDIQPIIFTSGLPYSIEYRPDDGYFSLELYKDAKENTNA